MGTVLESVLSVGEGECFYSFSNADGKTWMMPARNMRVAMNLYQPSGRNGKLLKALFPWLHGMAPVRRVMRAEKLRCRLCDELNGLLCKLFHEERIEFSVFGGTPCVHQKVTIQISRGKRILGYCKVTGSEEVAALFRGEACLLRSLEEHGMEGMPRCLYCGEMASGLSLFVQSTTKTRHSKVLHEWSALHGQYLDALRRATVRNVAFEGSDYRRTLQTLRSHLDWLPPFMDRRVIERAIDRVTDANKGKMVSYSAYHADFTPWNMFVEKGRLFVFDWEYARMTYPPMLDRYHFFTQSAIFEKRWQAADIVAYLQSADAAWVDRESYVLYLLDIISRFTEREKGNVDGDVARSMKIWNDLLVYLSK